MRGAKPWEEVGALRVRRRIAALVADRLNMIVRLVDAQGRSPAGEPAGTASPEEVLQAGRHLRSRAGRADARGADLQHGERLIVSPIDVAGHRAGFVVAEGPAIAPADEGWLLDCVRAIARECALFLEDLEPRPPDAEHSERQSYGPLIGSSASMRRLFALLDKIAGSDSSILVQGENGTGKELVARAIHDGSPRKDLPYVVVNCSAFNDNLLDSELFGHRRGAFTGAVSDKRGLFEVADGGTFFLDEIGDTSAALQAKLLRVLQDGSFLPVGGTVEQHVDVRVVAATHRDLEARVRSGRFRQDLFYRLNVITLNLPPLRDRPGDLGLLIDHFLTRAALGRRIGRKRLSTEARALLERHSWPGNVRELENEIERLVVLSGSSSQIDVGLLSSRITAADGRSVSMPEPIHDTLPRAIEHLERSMIAAALLQTRGNKTKAATLLGVSRRNLIRKCQAYEL